MIKKFDLEDSFRGKRTARSVWSAVFSTALFLGFLALLRFGALPFTGCAPVSEPRNAGGASSETEAKVTTRREGNVIHVSVENSEVSEITATFRFGTENLKSSVLFPHTATFGPGKTEAFTLEPIDCSVPWSFSFTNYFKLGSSQAVHDDSVIYQLPYGPRSNFEVSQ